MRHPFWHFLAKGELLRVFKEKNVVSVSAVFFFEYTRAIDISITIFEVLKLGTES